MTVFAQQCKHSQCKRLCTHFVLQLHGAVGVKCRTHHPLGAWGQPDQTITWPADPVWHAQSPRCLTKTLSVTDILYQPKFSNVCGLTKETLRSLSDTTITWLALRWVDDDVPPTLEEPLQEHLPLRPVDEWPLLSNQPVSDQTKLQRRNNFPLKWEEQVVPLN